jgi:hypothetical protein
MKPPSSVISAYAKCSMRVSTCNKKGTNPNLVCMKSPMKTRRGIDIAQITGLAFQGTRLYQ